MIKSCTCTYKFTTDLYDKREVFNFTIVNYPHMDSNIPSKPAYGVFISQLIRYLRVCGNYQHFVYRSQLHVGYKDRGSTMWCFVTPLKSSYSDTPLHYASISGLIVDCVCLPLCVFSTKNKHVTVR